jgi:hypothetical protein
MNHYKTYMIPARLADSFLCGYIPQRLPKDERLKLLEIYWELGKHWNAKIESGVFVSENDISDYAEKCYEIDVSTIN